MSDGRSRDQKCVSRETMDDKNAFIKDPVIELLQYTTDKRHLAKMNP